VAEFGSEDQGSLFVGALMTSPMDKVEKFSGTTSIVNLGIKGFRKFQIQVHH